MHILIHSVTPMGRDFAVKVRGEKAEAEYVAHCLSKGGLAATPREKQGQGPLALVIVTGTDEEPLARDRVVQILRENQYVVFSRNFA